MVNQCVICGKELPEGDMVCPLCKKSYVNRTTTNRGPTWVGYYTRIVPNKKKYTRKRKHKNLQEE